jgi:threonylcarbamoyladenosine tRNA methylthiotransferase MtaB
MTSQNPKQNSNVTVVNFGCRLNSLESQLIAQLAKEAGLQDTVIVNGCAVTNEAERQVKQAVRKWIRAHPEKRVIVTGCGAQLDKDSYAAIEGVHAVIGNEDKRHTSTYHELKSQESSKTPFIKVNDTVAIKNGALHLIEGHSGLCRGFVEIQNGCRHRCTFCTIHMARGESLSHPESLILEQIGTLINQGTQEIVLTGVDITSYGEDFEVVGHEKRPTLGSLCQKILTTFPDLPRLRISSIDCMEADPLLLEVIQSESRFMPHIHLSLQAGNNLILKRMLRRHSREDSILFCQKLRTLRPDIVLGSDFIVGFPSETDAMFEETRSLVAACNLVWLHVFPFSARNRAPASRMPRQTEPHVIKERAAKLRADGKKQALSWLHGRLHTSTSVLVETLESDGTWQGKDPYFARVNVTSNFPDLQVGDRTEVFIEAVDADNLSLKARSLHAKTGKIA